MPGSCKLNSTLKPTVNGEQRKTSSLNCSNINTRLSLNQPDGQVVDLEQMENSECKAGNSTARSGCVDLLRDSEPDDFYFDDFDIDDLNESDIPDYYEAPMECSTSKRSSSVLPQPVREYGSCEKKTVGTPTAVVKPTKPASPGQ